MDSPEESFSLHFTNESQSPINISFDVCQPKNMTLKQFIDKAPELNYGLNGVFLLVVLQIFSRQLQLTNVQVYAALL